MQLFFTDRFIFLFQSHSGHHDATSFTQPGTKQNNKNKKIIITSNILNIVYYYY